MSPQTKQLNHHRLIQKIAFSHLVLSGNLFSKMYVFYMSYRFARNTYHKHVPQYRTIRSGDLRLLQEVSRQDIELKSIKFQDYSLLFRRTAYRARVNGVDGVSSCVAIKYSGRDAYAVCFVLHI